MTEFHVKANFCFVLYGAHCFVFLTTDALLDFEPSLYQILI